MAKAKGKTTAAKGRITPPGPVKKSNKPDGDAPKPPKGAGKKR